MTNKDRYREAFVTALIEDIQTAATEWPKRAEEHREEHSNDLPDFRSELERWNEEKSSLHS